MKLKILFSFFLCLAVLQANAQEDKQITLMGKVMDSQEKGVAGAYIYVDSVLTESKTNIRGYYQVKISPDTKSIAVYSEDHGLQISEYLGEKSMSFMFLEESSLSPEEQLVNLGYIKKARKDITTSASHLDDEDLDRVGRFATIYDMIDSQVPGVRVVNNRIIVRGVKTLTGSTEPLFVVNGIVQPDVSYIPPIQVKSISVLKGADASAFGSRGANGVIMIDLK